MNNMTPPHDLEAEQAVLGSIILDNERIHDLDITTNSFYRSAHKTIFKALQYLINKQVKADIITLSAKLKKDKEIDGVGGSYYITQVISSVVVVDRIEHYANILKQCESKRDLLDISFKIQKDIYAGEINAASIADKAVKDSLEVMSSNTSGDDIVKIGSGAGDIIDDLFDKQDRKGLLGITTGFSQLDYLTGGFKDSDLIVIGARPKMGKTSLLLNLAMNAAESGAGVGVFSIEMTYKQLVTRAIVSDCEIDRMRLERTQLLNDSEQKKIGRTLRNLDGLPIVINDKPGITMQEIKVKARKMVVDHGVKVIFVDYLGKIRRPKGDRSNNLEHTGNTICDLKLLARELDVPVVVLSQLSRNLESRDDKEPKPSDLRNSGEIEQEANVIMFLYRDHVYNNDADPRDAKVIVSANRDGMIGTAYLTWRGEITKFIDRSF